MPHLCTFAAAFFSSGCALPLRLSKLHPSFKSPLRFHLLQEVFPNASAQRCLPPQTF